MSLMAFLDVVVAALLVVAIGAAVVLNRRLAALRAARSDFEQFVERFNTAAARADLYRNVGESVNGKSVALINVTEDRSTTWLLLFSIPKLVITGDVVEFTQEGGQPQTMQPATLQAQ